MERNRQNLIKVICFDVKKQKRSHNGFEYSLDIWDKFSGEEWTFPRRRKSDADPVGEFLDQTLQDFLAFRGIYHMTAPGNTPNYSPAESRMKGLNHMQQLLLKQAGFDQSKWVLARECATFIRNRTLKCSNYANKTPCEIFFGKAPDLSSMCAFGCPCFIHIPSAQRKAWDDAA